MLKFFRSIRQGLLAESKVNKYLLYAIGEIVLVVIGILIALSINNWNEGRKNKLRESVLVKNIIEDLRLDSAHIHQALNELSNQLETVDNLIANALGREVVLKDETLGLIRYSSDFRPISQRNHAESVSNLENEYTRELLQNYYLQEDQVRDIFLEYEDIIHNKIRPYLRDVGMHNLASVHHENSNVYAPAILHTDVLKEQLGEVKFQQLLFERRLKTGSFQALLNLLNTENQELINILSKHHN